MIDAADVHPVLIVFFALAGDMTLYGWLIWDTGQRELVPEWLRSVIRTTEDVRQFGKRLSLSGGIVLGVVCVLVALGLLSPKS